MKKIANYGKSLLDTVQEAQGNAFISDANDNATPEGVVEMAKTINPHAYRIVRRATSEEVVKVFKEIKP